MRLGIIACWGVGGCRHGTHGHDETVSSHEQALETWPVQLTSSSNVQGVGRRSRPAKSGPADQAGDDANANAACAPGRKGRRPGPRAQEQTLGEDENGPSPQGPWRCTGRGGEGTGPGMGSPRRLRRTDGQDRPVPARWHLAPRAMAAGPDEATWLDMLPAEGGEKGSLGGGVRKAMLASLSRMPGRQAGRQAGKQGRGGSMAHLARRRGHAQLACTTGHHGARTAGQMPALSDNCWCLPPSRSATAQWRARKAAMRWAMKGEAH